MGGGAGAEQVDRAACVAQALLKPQRLDRNMASDDPRFEQKVADIIGIYVNPPQHAAVSAWMKRQQFKRWIGSTRYC